MSIVYINGKFTAQAVTGVQRSARCWLEALDRLPEDLGDETWILLHPPGGRPPALERIVCREVGPAGWPLHLWEQVALPWFARQGRLVNLAGAAPWFARRQTCFIHDAAVFDQPQAYSAAFVRWYRALFRHLARSGQRVGTVSEFSQQRLSAALGLPAAALGIASNGCDHLEAVEPDEGLLSRIGVRAGRFVLAVGSSNPTKNLQALERAFLQLQRPADLRLVVAGGVNPRVFAPSAPPGTAADPAVLRIGPVGDAELKALYRGASFFVFPSVYEGFGIPPLEAMACGCPVAASDAASLPEVCGPAALYFDPRDDAAISRALQRMLADAGLREQLRAAGRERAARFTWAQGARQLHRFVMQGEGAA